MTPEALYSVVASGRRRLGAGGVRRHRGAADEGDVLDGLETDIRHTVEVLRQDDGLATLHRTRCRAQRVAPGVGLVFTAVTSGRFPE